MALVAYDNSDSSDYEDDNVDNTSILIKKQNAAGLAETQAIINTEVDINKDDKLEKSLFNNLPQPSFSKTKVYEEDDEFLHKKATSVNSVKIKPQITIPSLNDFKDVGSTIPASRPKINGKKSGLLSILPQPKNCVTSTTKSFIPNVLKQKPPPANVTCVKKKQVTLSPVSMSTASVANENSDDSDDDVQSDFFSMNKTEETLPDNLPIEDLPVEEKEISNPPTNKTPRSIESYFKKEPVNLNHDFQQIEEDNFRSSEDMYTNNVPESTHTEVVLDDDAILKLCGTRGKRKREEIQIVDVNQQEVLKEAREMLMKGLMDDTSKRQSASKKRGNEPTTQQRRKHQITYLAHQAKANEVELQNQWANNRMTKRKTQSKYGF